MFKNGSPANAMVAVDGTNQADGALWKINQNPTAAAAVGVGSFAQLVQILSRNHRRTGV